LLIDFGSTFTKVTAVDLDKAEVVGKAQAASTVATDVCEGLLHALAMLQDRHGLFKGRPDSLDILEDTVVLSCSSAAGGLRLIVVGLVPGLTVEAGNAAALGAGAKIVGSFSFKITQDDIRKMEQLRPDMILLTGGTDGGDADTILHNAVRLAESSLAAPILVAGNRAAAERVCNTLANAGKEIKLAGNVMPEAHRFAPEAAQDEIRELFMKQIVSAKGIDQIKTHVPVLLPTPMAVLQGALLASRGSGPLPGWGELLLVDVGGATTDVHSIGEGAKGQASTIPKGLPEPYAKRTVEGDLGIRWNAATILERVGRERLFERFQTIFPEFDISREILLAYVQEVTAETSQNPSERWHYAADAALARIAVDLAIERHAGKIERYYAKEGETWLQYGKDLTGIGLLIGTGGVFTYNPFVERILSGSGEDSKHKVLRPQNPAIFIDRDYILYAVGLLAETYPEVAFKIFKKYMHPLKVRPAGDASIAELKAILSGGHGHSHDCC